jgi:RAP domain
LEPEFLQTETRRLLMHVASIEEEWNRELLLEVSDHLLDQNVGDVVIGGRTADDVFHLDMTLPDMLANGRLVAIEILDTRHMSSNTRQALGRNQLRQRVLQSYGYHVITLSAIAWASQDSAALLTRLLAGCERRSSETSGR